MPPTKGLVIAGTQSGCGKTSVTLGLMAALRRRGLTVQPFKVGPDFIDPGHHQAVTGRPSHTLDGWMLDRDTVAATFARYAHDADVAVVEGVMGLFDGASATDEDGSTAQIAKWLGLPVLLVVDARSMARSAAALVAGFTLFDTDLTFAGAVFNKTGGPSHQAILAEATATSPIPSLGFLPRADSLATPSRHLGLVTAQDHGWEERAVTRLADWIEQHLDLDRLLQALPDLDLEPPPAPGAFMKRARIGLARDAAFSFYYPENLRLLEEAGAELVPFSPAADLGLPPDLDGLYLGGGYPELHAPALAENLDMRVDIKRFSLAGGPIYAECGGFMYLLAAIEEAGGKTYPMAGAFNTACRMADRFQALGYRAVTTTARSLLGPAGTTVCGHEFHYSHLTAPPTDTRTVYTVSSTRGPRPPEGYLRDNTLGSYIHLHFASNPAVAGHFVDMCAARRVRRSG